MLKHDPKELFTISTISRKGIAELLNNAIDAAGAIDVDRFRTNDPRLTDKVCREIADLLYDAASQEDEVDQLVADQFICELSDDMRKRPKPRRSSAPARTKKRR